MRPSNILIISFIIFIFAFAGYSLWKSKSSPTLSNISKEEKEIDMRMAQQYLHNAEPERSLPIIHKYKEEMESDSFEGKKWLQYFIDASTALNDADQLMMIYQFKPDALKDNEQGALILAEAFIKNENQSEFVHLRNLWKNRETKLASWTLLDADLLLQQDLKQKAYDLLKTTRWTGKLEDERLIRMALIKLHDDPQEALKVLNAEYSKNPKNCDICLFRAKIYESQQQLSLAEQGFIAASRLEPHNVYLQDQLAEFYRRQKNYTKALEIWKKLLSQSTNDQMWVKTLFWERMTTPASLDWKNLHLPEEKSKAFLAYLLGLKSGHFWDTLKFEKIPHHVDVLSDYQATYWYRLLQALKQHDEKEALTLLNHNPFETSSWAPMLELTLRRILNYRKHGTLLIEEDTSDTDPLLKILSNQDPHIPVLYKELDALAQQEADNHPTFKIPEDLQALMCNQEIFAATLFSEGWTEAALQLQPEGILSVDFPEWYMVFYVNGLRQNRSNQDALKFIAQQKQTPIMSLLKAEIDIAEGKTETALVELEKLKSHAGDIGTKAVWLISQMDIQKGQYRKAAEVIRAHPQLSQTLQGQEALGRIAVLIGDTETASEIYQKIKTESKEAKSYLARQAYQQKNWILARELTEDLLNESPGSTQLQENLKKIIAQEKIKK